MAAHEDERELYRMLSLGAWNVSILYYAMRKRGFLAEDDLKCFSMRLARRAKSPHSRVQRVRRGIYTVKSMEARDG